MNFLVEFKIGGFRLENKLEEKKVEPEKYVVVFIELGKDGKLPYDIERYSRPYGHHHIIKFYKQGDFWVVGMIDGTIQDIEKIKEIAKIIADGVEIEIDPDFYLKYHQWCRS